jgi:hypothetical protein
MLCLGRCARHLRDADTWERHERGRPRSAR